MSIYFDRQKRFADEYCDSLKEINRLINDRESNTIETLMYQATIIYILAHIIDHYISDNQMFFWDSKTHDVINNADELIDAITTKRCIVTMIAENELMERVA